jgi:hypothetical protein
VLRCVPVPEITLPSGIFKSEIVKSLKTPVPMDK